jgi:hypothetical protein
MGMVELSRDRDVEAADALARGMLDNAAVLPA